MALERCDLVLEWCVDLFWRCVDLFWRCEDLPYKDLSFISMRDLYLIFVRFCQKQQNPVSEVRLLPLTKVNFIGSQAEAAKSCF